MSEIENPYQSPQTSIIPERSHTDHSLTETMLQYLYEASPWLRFIGILGYIGACLCFVSGVIMAISMSVFSGLFGELGEFPFWILGIIYIPMGLLLFFPARFTHEFGEKIRQFKFNNSSNELEEAFKNNKSLWKFYGILCIIYLAFIPVVFIGAIVVGVVSAINIF